MWHTSKGHILTNNWQVLFNWKQLQHCESTFKWFIVFKLKLNKYPIYFFQIIAARTHPKLHTLNRILKLFLKICWWWQFMKMENVSEFLYLANVTQEIHDVEKTIKPSADDEAEYARLINVVCRPILIALGKVYENVQFMRMLFKVRSYSVY